MRDKMPARLCVQMNRTLRAVPNPPGERHPRVCRPSFSRADWLRGASQTVAPEHHWGICVAIRTKGKIHNCVIQAMQMEHLAQGLGAGRVPRQFSRDCHQCGNVVARCTIKSPLPCPAMKMQHHRQRFLPAPIVRRQHMIGSFPQRIVLSQADAVVVSPKDITNIVVIHCLIRAAYAALPCAAHHNFFRRLSCQKYLLG